MNEYLISLLFSLAGVAPSLVFWMVVIVFAAVMRRRSGGRGERFLIIGSSLKIAGNLLGVPLVVVTPWLLQGGYSTAYISSVTLGYGISLNTISMAGIICFLYAFWVKFKERNHVLVESTT